MHKNVKFLIPLGLLAAPLLNAQASEAPVVVMPWLPLALSPGEDVDVRWRWVSQDQDIWMEFSNQGSKAIHFNMYFPMIEKRDAAILRPRMHMDPDQRVGAPALVKLPLAKGLALPAVPRLVDVRVGSRDEGAFWSGYRSAHGNE